METEKLRRRSCRLNMEIARHYRCPPAKNKNKVSWSVYYLLVMSSSRDEEFSDRLGLACD